jgi:hypothetical protein
MPKYTVTYLKREELVHAQEYSTLPNLMHEAENTDEVRQWFFETYPGHEIIEIEPVETR